MRRTGKLYTLTLLSAIAPLYASTMVAMWSDSSSKLHLWGDVIPQGFGMASVITTTLIVGTFRNVSISPDSFPVGTHYLCFQKGCSCCYRQ